MFLDVSDILAELTSFLPDAVIDGRPGTEVAGIVPVARVRPTTVSQLGQIVRWASQRKAALAAVGGGTKLGVGNPPSRLDVVVDMGALDVVTQYHSEDLVLTVQAGATIQKVQSVVRQDSLLLPLDPQAPDRATMGGVIACADHGPRRRQYGGLRDVILGLKAMLPDGSLASFGGQTLKNVAGYDVGKLFIGSLGTIGVIAEVSIRLLPQPASEELLLVRLPRLEMGRQLVASVLQSPLLPSSLELMSPSCAELLDLKGVGTKSMYLMLIGLEGHPAAVGRQVREINAFCRGLKLRKTTVHRASEMGFSPSEGWEAYSQVRDKALHTRSCAGFRCTVPLALAWELAGSLEERARMNDVEVSYRMSCGTGQLEAYAAGSPTGVRAFAEWVRAGAEQRGGAATVLDGWPVLGKEFDAWGGRRSDHGLIRALKQKFDPEGIMNPGRFIERL